jgi:hypothetical protein
MLHGYLSVLFALMQKEPKKSRPNHPDSYRDRWFGRANAHEHSSKIANTFCLRADSAKVFASCLVVGYGGAVFFVYIF